MRFITPVGGSSFTADPVSCFRGAPHRALALGIHADLRTGNAEALEFGDATFDGSTGALHLNAPIVGMAATPENLVHLVHRIPAGAAWQVIGIGRANLPMTAIGLAMGGNARTGMEDTLLLRRGVPAGGNGELVERLAGVARALERPPAELEETRQLLSLPARAAAPSTV